MNRREFLMMGASAAATAATFRLRADGVRAAMDPDLAVLLSDMHVNGARYAKDDPTKLVPSFQADRLRMAVVEIMRLDPLPSKVICFGDFAFSNGQLADYELAREILKPLLDAGMELTVGMGNHDRRENFLKCYPEYEKRILVPGRIVSKVEFRYADFYMLDTLVQCDDANSTDNPNPVPGMLTGGQREFLGKLVKNAKRPIFLGSHHDPHEVKVNAGFMPCVCGYIHGHDHFIHHDTLWCGDYRKRHMARRFVLPSTGHWGDIGYALFRVEKDRAVLTVRERECYFPEPAEPGEPIPEIWEEMRKFHDGMKVVFPYSVMKDGEIANPWFSK